MDEKKAVNEINPLIFPVSFVQGNSPKIIRVGILKDAFGEMKTPATRLQVEKVRAAKNDDDKKAIKTKSSGFIIGEFSYRNDNHLINYAPIVCLDIDNIPTLEKVHSCIKSLKKNNHIYFAQISPSGDGLRVLIIHDGKAENHKKNYNEIAWGIARYLGIETGTDKDKDFYIDLMCSNVSRHFYMSTIDTDKPDEFIFNPNFEVWKCSKVNAPPTTKKSKGNYAGLRPGDDFNSRGDVLPYLIDAGWTDLDPSKAEKRLCRPGKNKNHSAILDTNRRLFFQFSNSVEMFPKKHGNKCGQFDYFGVYARLIHNNDWDEATKDLAAQGYGETKIISSTAPTDKPKPKPSKTDEPIETFWKVTFKKNGTKKVEFARFKFYTWLSSKGYARHHLTRDSWQLIKQVNNIISKVSKSDLKKFVKDYINNELPENFDTINKDTLREIVTRGAPSYFSNDLLEFLPAIEVDSYRDTSEVAYIYYQNCVLKSTSEGNECIEYADLNGYVWEDQIIKRDFRILENSDNDFLEFLQIVAGSKDSIQGGKFSLQRFSALERVIGYSLHSFKDPANCPAIIINDQVSDDDRPEGGTGKGIFIKSLAHIKRKVTIGGKNFKFDKSFAFQRLDIDTQLLVFEDVLKGFDFEKLFSIITEEITVEKKGKDEFTIDFEHSPKVFITTNYPIKGDGSSHERRRIELEFHEYFRNKSPLEHFGKRLFDDWDKDHWLRFDNYMMKCLRAYLVHGVEQPPLINLSDRKLREETHPDFVLFCSDWLQPGEFSNQHIFKTLVEAYPDFQRYKQGTISKWVKLYLEKTGASFDAKGKVKGSNLRGVKIFSMQKKHA